MIIKVNKFLELLKAKEDEIIKTAIKSDLNEVETLKYNLFNEVHKQFSLEDFVYDTCLSFAHENLTEEVVFANRNNIFLNYIYDVLKESNCNDFKASCDLDDVYTKAGFYYSMAQANLIKDELLTIYSLRDVVASLCELDLNETLDSSNYCDFNDEDTLVNSFIEEIKNRASISNGIINIDEYSQELCEEYFGISL